MAAGRVPTIVSTLPNGTVKRARANVAARGRVFTGDQNADEMQRRLRAEAAPAGSLPFGNGNLIAGQNFSTGVQLIVNHGLGRPFQGFFLVNPRGYASGVPAATFFGETPLTLSSIRIVLYGLGVFTADVWVY